MSTPLVPSFKMRVPYKILTIWIKKIKKIFFIQLLPNNFKLITYLRNNTDVDFNTL